jgi:hypothetical protein
MILLRILPMAVLLLACSPSGEEHARPARAATPPVQTASVAAVTKPSADTPRPLTEQQRTAHVWMRALFGAAYDATEQHALIDLEIDGAAAPYWMTLVSSTALPDERVALVVNGMPWDKDGPDMPGIATEGLLNVYLLRRDGDAWVVDERHQNLASMGGMGRIGEVRWVSLGAARPGFIVTARLFNRGDAYAYSRIYELGNGVRELANLMLGSNKADGCTPERDACWDIEGSIRFAEPPADGYADMLVEFTGKTYRLLDDAQEEPAEQVLKQVRETVRYRFDGKAYAKVSGANPISDS